MSAIVVQELRRTFAGQVAVDNLSLSVEAGQIYGLVGPDGAGKTTTLRLLAGLLDPDGGRVALLGRDPFGRDGSFRESLGYMPQQYSLYGDLTVDENLAFFREMACLSREAFAARKERLLALTRLAPFGRRRASALSGGMYKKLALACVLLHEPKILLLDEPTNGVDPVSRREFWDLLHGFLADGMAIVFATPTMDEAARCHHVGLLYQGRLLAEGAPSELVRAFDHPVFRVGGERASVESWIEKSPDVLAFTPAGEQLRIVVRRGRELLVRGAEGDALRLVLRGRDGSRSPAFDATPASPTFEDVFLARVHERHEQTEA